MFSPGPAVAVIGLTPVWGCYLRLFPACLDCWKEKPLAWPTSPFLLSLPSKFCFGEMLVAKPLSLSGQKNMVLLEISLQID